MREVGCDYSKCLDELGGSLEIVKMPRVENVESGSVECRLRFPKGRIVGQLRFGIFIGKPMRNGLDIPDTERLRVATVEVGQEFR
jgi:hypothetical protein